jgi:hypothetical protein
VGSSDFRRKSSELAKKVDNTYNTLLSTQRGRNVLPERFLQNVEPEAQIHNDHSERRKNRFLNFLMTGQSPPLQQNVRFPVSDDDITNYSAIVELAHSAKHKK